ncbi:hypothetical protein Syun_003411 [Stephania yunnanensis]|uniref:Uncharacterized protein n=1 Tax=Stephania yunnanensis TaxID=152371 RepID=A0AAP0L504_9MAGN
MPQIESDEDQLLVLEQPPTLPCTFGKPYKGVEVRERLQIFYTIDTFVLDEPDTIDTFVLGVPDELLNLKEGVHDSLPKYVDAPFVIEGWSAKFCRWRGVATNSDEGFGGSDGRGRRLQRQRRQMARASEPPTSADRNGRPDDNSYF